MDRRDFMKIIGMIVGGMPFNFPLPKINTFRPYKVKNAINPCGEIELLPIIHCYLNSVTGIEPAYPIRYDMSSPLRDICIVPRFSKLPEKIANQIYDVYEKSSFLDDIRRNK